MLVKHNLLNINATDVIFGASQAKFFNIDYRRDSISFKGVERPKTPFVLGHAYKQYKDKYSKLVIKNTGEGTIIVNTPYKNNVIQNDITLAPGEYTEISRKNLDNGSCTWICIPNIDDYNKSYEIKIINFIVTEDGFTDIYLPNINTLPEDKQPLLPPEGDYKEIQAR